MMSPHGCDTLFFKSFQTSGELVSSQWVNRGLGHRADAMWPLWLLQNKRTTTVWDSIPSRAFIHHHLTCFWAFDRSTCAQLQVNTKLSIAGTGHLAYGSLCKRERQPVEELCEPALLANVNTAKPADINAHASTWTGSVAPACLPVPAATSHERNDKYLRE